MKHDLDRDACCIHCGMDLCDLPRGERVPPCEVWDAKKRASNFAAWLAESEAEWDGVPDPEEEYPY